MTGTRRERGKAGGGESPSCLLRSDPPSLANTRMQYTQIHTSCMHTQHAYSMHTHTCTHEHTHAHIHKSRCACHMHTYIHTCTCTQVLVPITATATLALRHPHLVRPADSHMDSLVFLHLQTASPSILQLEGRDIRCLGNPHQALHGPGCLAEAQRRSGTGKEQGWCCPLAGP